MEPVERVLANSHQGRIFVADQRVAASTPKKKRKRAAEPAQEAEYWAVKRIVDEKKKDGKRYYLIDWEDHPSTGKSYENSWEPAEYVTQDAIDDWNLTFGREKSKRKRKTTATEEKRRAAEEKRRDRKETQEERDVATASGSEVPPSSTEPDSQPVRPANQTRASLRTNGSPHQRPSKRPQRAGITKSAKLQSDSQVSDLVIGKEREIKDSYEDDEDRTGEGVRVLVELPHLGDSFDRDAYAKILLESSQSSQPLLSSQPTASTPTISHIPKNTPRKPFIWDEDTPVIIPDSQELLGSLSYEPVEHSSSTEAVTTAELSTAIQTESDRSLLEHSHTLPSVQTRHSGHPHCSSPEVGAESISTHTLDSQRGALAGGSSGHHSQSPAESVRSQEARRNSCGQSNRVIEETQPLGSPNIQSSLQNVDCSSQANRTKDTGSDSGHQSLHSHSQLDQADSNLIIDNINPQYDTGTSQKVFVEVLDSQALDLTTYHSNSIVQTQKSNSQVESTWQAAQIVSQPSSTNSEFLSGHLVEGLGITQEPLPPPSSIESQLAPSQIIQISEAEQLYLSPSPAILPSIEQAEHNIPTASLLRQQSSLRHPAIPKIMENMSVTNLLLQARAKAAAAQAERRASSIYTPTPPPASPGPVVLNQMLPPRDEAGDRSVLISQIVPSPKPSIEIDSGEVEFDDEPIVEQKSQVLSLGPNEYVVPLPMVGIVRSVILTDIKNNNRKIRRFLNENSIETDLVHEMKSLIDRMKLCCSHQWLVEEHSATQEQMSDTWVAKFSTNCSTKCIFVVDLLSELWSNDTHIAILVQPGKMMQIMESILRYKDFRFKRLDQPGSFNPGTSSLEISLVPTDFDMAKVTVPSADLVIAFDSSFDRQSPFGTLRPSDSVMSVPLLYLTVSYSAEHLELCIEKNLKDMDRLISLLILAKQLEEKAGILPLDYLGPDEAGKAVAKYLLAGGKQPWPLLPIPFIEELVDFDFESSQEEMEVGAQDLSDSTTQTHNTSSRSESPRHGSKRPFAPDDVSESSKRPRLSPADGEQRDDVKASTLEPVSSSLNGKLTTETNNDVEDEDLLSSLMKKVKHLEFELQKKEASEQAWHNEKQKLDAQIADFELSNQRILPRYQEALNDRGEAQHNMKVALERERIAKQKADRLAEDLSKLREAKVLVDTNLLNASAALANSSIPAVAEFEKLKTDLVAAKEENAALQRRLENTQGTVNYMQENYQTASNAATAAANEVAELQEKFDKIKVYASNNILEIHKINTTSTLREQLNRIDELTAQKAEVEQQLERKSEELKSMLNGRRPTRGTSVPRSPRMNSTMSPRNRVLGSNSRGNSPAPGDVFASNRNTFGDALLFPTSGPSVTGRWGQHLS